MFSLIISIIAIALAAVLLLTSAFYGGDALTEGTAKAQAASLANEAQQITAGFDLYRVENGGASPQGVTNAEGVAADANANGFNDDLVSERYLKQAPATGWTITGRTLSTPATVSDDVCGYIDPAVNGLTCADSDAGVAPDNNVVTFQM